MGCDIHMYVEKRNKENGKWEIVGNVTSDDGWIGIDYQPYTDRNYNLFSILANVRNYGDGFIPIAKEKGVPKNASKEYAEIVSSWSSDGHSYSYLTIKELLNYDWTQKVTLQGYVDMVVYEKWSRWDKKGFPSEYCGSVGGGNVKHISNEEADELFQNASYGKERHEIANNNKNTFTLAKWEVTYAECVSDFLTNTLTELLKLSNGIKNMNNVRIVFFFDN